MSPIAVVYRPHSTDKALEYIYIYIYIYKILSKSSERERERKETMERGAEFPHFGNRHAKSSSGKV